MQNTSATIYQHIQLKYWAFCTLLKVLSDLNQKLERTCPGGFVSLFIHWRLFQPIVHGFLTAHPILQNFDNRRVNLFSNFTRHHSITHIEFSCGCKVLHGTTNLIIK